MGRVSSEGWVEWTYYRPSFQPMRASYWMERWHDVGMRPDYLILSPQGSSSQFFRDDDLKMRRPRLALLSLYSPDLEQYLVSLGERRFRYDQIHDWIYDRGVTNYDDM